jgi:putative spermidine/putrescine transport system ATP-binding protein
VSRATATLADGTLLVAQVDSAEAATLSVGDRVRVRIDPTPILVVAS